MSVGIWRNRLVGQADVAPEQLLAHPLNFRIHPMSQQEALEGSLNELGWFKRVIVQAGTDMVIDGHARVALALRRGEPTVPVDYVNLSDEEARLALAAGDHMTSLAAVDRQQLDALLADVATENVALQEALDGLAASAGIMPVDAPSDDEPRSAGLGDGFGVLVVCPDAAEQVELLERLTDEGYSCMKSSVSARAARR